MENLRRTPLYSKHLELKARIVPFAGYEMPVQYTGVLEETKATRAQCGLFDVSHMGQFSLHGKNALQAVQQLVTNDLNKIQLGQAQYNLLCNTSGGVIDDLIIYRRAEDWIYICVNASNREKDREWMKSHLPKDIRFEDESDDTALIAVQGPNAEKLIAEHGDATLVRSMKYYWAANSQVFGKECYLSRTGYTGEDGFEIYCSAADAVYFWDSLLHHGKAAGLVPVGLGARDTLRLEMGYPLHGHELSEEITPAMAGLNWVVKPAKGDFIGKEVIAREIQTGPREILKAFIIEDKRIARQGYSVLNSSGEKVGQITSGTHSPHVGAPIALGFVKATAASQTHFGVDVRGTAIPAKPVSLPFVPSHIKKNPKP